MPREPKQSMEDKLIKTAKIFLATNLILIPFYCADSSFGLALSLVANAALMKAFHDLGKKRRWGSNLINDANTFFSKVLHAEDNELDNILRNVINGGAAIYDKTSMACTEMLGQ